MGSLRCKFRGGYSNHNRSQPRVSDQVRLVHIYTQTFGPLSRGACGKRPIGGNDRDHGNDETCGRAAHVPSGSDSVTSEEARPYAGSGPSRCT